PAEERELGEEARVAVARHDLGRDRLRPKPEPPQDGGLDRGLVVGEGADRARELAVGDRGARRGESAPPAPELRVPARALEAEGDDLGMDAVRAADHGRAAMAERLGADRRALPSPSARLRRAPPNPPRGSRRSRSPLRPASPVLPKPPSPRSLSGSCCTSRQVTRATGPTTSCAMRSPRRTETGSRPRLTS